MNLSELKNLKRVAVFGMGKSGISSIKALLKLKLETYAVNSGEPSTWSAFSELSSLLETGYFYNESQASELFSQVDLIVLSPGIPLTHPSLQLAQTQKVKIISEIELGFILAPNVPVIAITGTNGKTTTTTMIAEVLTKSGMKVFCGGNIGIPYTELFLSNVQYDWAVIEVSSFQLETIETFHPKIAFVLNVSLNHTERYLDIKDYAQAKFQVFKNMNESDLGIIGHQALFILDWIKGTQIQKIIFDPSTFDIEFKGFDFSKTKLMGEHNRENFYCAYLVMKKLNIPHLKNIFQDFIDHFKGVPHRLEYVRTWKGLSIFNDAKSTNMDATKTALNAFRDDLSPFYLVMGGKLRNESDTFLKDLLPFKNKIQKIYLIGETADRLFHELKTEMKVHKVDTLENLMIELKEKELKGNLVFSPSHPSFDQFKNYVHRGEVFKTLINDLP